MSDTETESVDSISRYEEMPQNELDQKEDEQVNTIRNTVKEWKLRELEKNTQFNKKANGLDPLRKYIAKSARLYYDLQNFLQTEKNRDENLEDLLYMAIVIAIGSPGGLSSHSKTLIQHMLQRDLVELPLTVEPRIVNSFHQKGLIIKQNFPDEE